jgi:hypothetical protein
LSKKKSRRKKQVYSPHETLKPTALDAALEQVARDLYEKACCGSKNHWSEIQSESQFRENREMQRKFFSAAHEGMRAAQDYIVSRVQSEANLSVSEELLYRGIADSIAWQFLGGQLCHARRLYKGHLQPNLQQSNFESVVATANTIVENNIDAMPLLSDLTSFVQIGDILSLNPDTGHLSIIEVKEGEVNNKISDFLDFYMESGCDRALGYFLAREGPHVARQLGRMVRQMGRMHHVCEIMTSGSSTDPDNGQRVIIPEEFFPIDYWDTELNHILQESEKKGWSLEIIDDCLFIACYAGDLMLPASHLAFNMWFDFCGGTAESPRARLIDSMMAPLGLPIFMRTIPVENIFDVLFGRKQVCMGINMDALLHKCKQVGLSVRSGTNKETSQIEQAGQKPFRHNGKCVFVGKGGKEMILMDGIFLRAFFHGQTPLSIIESLLSIDEPI